MSDELTPEVGRDVDATSENYEHKAITELGSHSPKCAGFGCLGFRGERISPTHFIHTQPAFAQCCTMALKVSGRGDLAASL